MKLSNKILIGFFGFIFLYLTAAFTEVRLRGTTNLMDDTNSIAETADVSGVSYLVLPKLDQQIEVIGSDKFRLEVRSMSGDLLQKLKYHVSGDTLTINQLDLEKGQRVRISIYVTKNSFAGMVVNGGWVDIKGLQQKVLSVSQIEGYIRMDDNNRVDKLDIKASNGASFNISNAVLDTLSVHLDNSKMIINSPIRLLKGSIKNDSYLYVIGSDEIQFKKDENSKLILD